MWFFWKFFIPQILKIIFFIPLEGTIHTSKPVIHTSNQILPQVCLHPSIPFITNLQHGGASVTLPCLIDHCETQSHPSHSLRTTHFVPRPPSVAALLWSVLANNPCPTHTSLTHVMNLFLTRPSSINKSPSLRILYFKNILLQLPCPIHSQNMTYPLYPALSYRLH